MRRNKHQNVQCPEKKGESVGAKEGKKKKGKKYREVNKEG